jgi:exopolysaccharide/PEP-CTERM locus tyrosine autokinase
VSIVERALAKVGVRGRAALEGSSGPAPRPMPPAANNAPKHFEDNGKQSLDLHLDALRSVGLAPPADMENLVAEELRVIKRPLLLNAENAHAPVANRNLVMIASALPGAGKTFLSFNLALSMASELDWMVLLVDADVSRPTLSRAFGLGDSPGLVNLLENEGSSLSEYVFKTSHPRLRFLPAGPTRTESKELLASQRMRSLVANLAQPDSRRIVVFDSPPLLLTSEARVLASYAGQIALVVESGVTSRRSVMEAIDLLDPAKAINLVLNKSRRLLWTHDYHYYGYEAYGSKPAS